LSESSEDGGGQGGFNNNSYISLGILGVVVSGVWMLASTLSGIRTEMAEDRSSTQLYEQKLEQEIADMKLGQTDRWTATDMFKWAVRLQRANEKGLSVPEPEAGK
jgi:hypothetical protein